jgi:hypothetical protein
MYCTATTSGQPQGTTTNNLLKFMKHVMLVKMLQKGPPWNASDAVYKSIHLLCENLCNQDIVVSANMLCQEYWKKTLARENVSDKAIWQRIACWLKSMKVVYCQVTHVAQNTRHNEAVVQGVVQTSIYFDMTGKVTLTRCRVKIVGAKSTGCSN